MRDTEISIHSAKSGSYVVRGEAKREQARRRRRRGKDEREADRHITELNDVARTFGYALLCLDTIFAVTAIIGAECRQPIGGDVARVQRAAVGEVQGPRTAASLSTDVEGGLPPTLETPHHGGKMDY